jgi:hypothetical protein
MFEEKVKKKNLSKPFILADDYSKQINGGLQDLILHQVFLLSFLFGVLEDEIDFSLKHRTRNHFLKEKCCRQ